MVAAIEEGADACGPLLPWAAIAPARHLPLGMLNKQIWRGAGHPHGQRADLVEVDGRLG